jgi:type IX secretion system substrate protein
MGKLKIALIVTVTMLIGMASYAQSRIESPSYTSNDLKIENQVHIYPNPSIDFVKVTIEESNLIDPKVVVHTIIGNRLNVYSEKTSTNEFFVDVKNLPVGYYLIAIKDETTGFSETYKFLKR